MKFFRIFCFSMILATMHMSSLPFGLANFAHALRWVKNRLVVRPIARGIVSDELAAIVPELQEKIEHTVRSVTFENNIPDFFEALSEDPTYKDIPDLIDPVIKVNGKAIKPGTCATIAVVDNQCIVTLALRAELICAMDHGILKNILIYMLKTIGKALDKALGKAINKAIDKAVDSSVCWTISVPCDIRSDFDVVQLSDVVLAAYSEAQDLSAVSLRLTDLLGVDFLLKNKLCL